MSPSEVASLLIETGAVPGEILERAGIISFSAVLDNPATLAKWKALRAQVPSFLAEVSITRHGTDVDLDEDEMPPPGTQFSIAVRKAQADGQLSLFFGASLKRMENELAGKSVVCIADMTSMSTFTTHRSRYQRWPDGVVANFTASEAMPNPRRIAHDASDGEIVPSDIRIWLLQSRPTDSSAAFQTWRFMSARKLMSSLSNQVFKQGNDTVFQLSGPPSRRFSLSDSDLLRIADRLDESATWVFGSGHRDADTRHLLVAAEWARTYREEALDKLGDGGLDSAKAAYAAYVKTGSKETLKALSDLRKTVNEDAQKTTQKAQDLSAGLWKDLAIATVPFVIKVLSDATKSENLWIACVFAIGAAIFLGVSYNLQTFMNRRFFAAQQASRNVWRKRLNQVLTNAEIEEISEGPINESLKDYDIIKTVVQWVYNVLIAVLVLFAAFQAYSAVTAPETTPLPTAQPRSPATPPT
ncbi:hypothetical protein EFD56_21215 [Rhizobium phaseoli]|uniref:hypothetical protein n=1 Tax=Rhizobium phaseoli TaxID=396 RepID=UPI000F885A4B|nr:hypothetical protein [Rhizobium phaseoli]RUM16840.1 hypothetical protein EFD56_21215 [Rhizobium phaseoli]